MNVWGRHFGKHTVTLGIGGDKVKNVIQRIGNIDANKEVRYDVLICGTNNIDNDVPEDILKDIKYAIQLIKCKC